MSVLSCCNSRASCQKGPTRHAYAWQMGPFWQDTTEFTYCVSNIDNIIVAFFLGFDRFIPAVDRFISVSTDSSLPAFMLLYPPPQKKKKKKGTLVNKMCIALQFEIILFHFIWNKYFVIR